MFDLGWSELLVVGVVALIVVGPKDLPVMFRTLGQFTGKARAMAREFTSAMNAAADESGVRDIQRDLSKMANPTKAGLKTMKDAADRFDKWDPMAATNEKSKSGGAAGKPATEGAETAALRAERTAQAEARKNVAEPEVAAMPDVTPAPEPMAQPDDSKT